MKYWMTTALSAAALTMGSFAGTAMAQPASQPHPAPQTSAQGYSDAQLEKFISASQKVAVISDEYTPRLQSTEDETQRQEVYREADQKMVEAVRTEGMSVDEFNSINQAIQNDPTLMQRVQNIAQ